MSNDKPQKYPAVICDLDGTLCDCEHRRHWVRPTDGLKPDWGKFFEEMENDELNYPVYLILKRLWIDHVIILVSGRPRDYHMKTIEWLRKNNVDFHHLFMRDPKDMRQDSIIKEEIYFKYIKDSFDVELVLDDRDQVVDLWRNKLKLPCFQVNYGDF